MSCSSYKEDMERPRGLGKAAWCRVSCKGSDSGSPFPAENSWAGNTRVDGPAFYRAALLCNKCFPATTAACLTPGAWDFPKEKRKWLRANSLHCRPSVATELILWFPQCQKGNLNNSAYYQNFKLLIPKQSTKNILRNDLNSSLDPSQGPLFSQE